MSFEQYGPSERDWLVRTIKVLLEVDKISKACLETYAVEHCINYDEYEDAQKALSQREALMKTIEEK